MNSKPILKLHSKSSTQTNKSCGNCGHRKGRRCTVLGGYIRIDKSTSEICGIENQAWLQKYGLFKRIKIYFFGEKQH